MKNKEKNKEKRYDRNVDDNRNWDDKNQSRPKKTDDKVALEEDNRNRLDRREGNVKSEHE